MACAAGWRSRVCARGAAERAGDRNLVDCEQRSAPGASPSSFTMGSGRPRDCSMRVCTPRSREAATIFIALVILAMLPTDFMRCLTVGGNAQKQAQCRRLASGERCGRGWPGDGAANTPIWRDTWRAPKGSKRLRLRVSARVAAAGGGHARDGILRGEGCCGRHARRAAQRGYALAHERAAGAQLARQRQAAAQAGHCACEGSWCAPPAEGGRAAATGPPPAGPACGAPRCAPYEPVPVPEAVPERPLRAPLRFRSAHEQARKQALLQGQGRAAHRETH